MTGLSLDQNKLDRLIDLMDSQDKINSEIRSILSGGFFKKPKREPKPEAKPEAAMKMDLDISGIEWKRSNKAGGGLAGPQDGWAWAFAYTQDGGILRETVQLLQALEQYGNVIVDQYEISLGGRDGNLLNRKKL